MRGIVCLFVTLAALLSCGPPPEMPSAPIVQTIEINSDELQVWEGGAKALPEATEAENPSRIAPGFEDGAARRFLESDYYKPAVQFSCARSTHAFEENLEEELKTGKGRSRLRALILLMRARAPASVDLQWKTLQETRGLIGAGTLLDGLQAQFSEDVILRALEVAPPENRYHHDSLLEWVVRAAGVIKSRRALPTLVRLSRSEHLGTSLAAERSLEDFDGDEGDQALAQCLLGWQYDAYIRAGRALLERNKPLLVQKLTSTLVPEGCRPWQAVLLARADDPAAVPVLCESIPKVGIIDREMFEHLGRLAREQDLPQLRLLILKARPEQQDRLTRLIEELTRKLSGQ